jgi:dTDP-4-amino-4,6-dideoxygalactose transaminase
LQACYAYLGHKPGDYPITEAYANQVLSLPLYNGMTEAEQNYVIEKINQWKL